QIADLEQSTLLPGFWEDPKRAQSITRRRSGLEQQIGAIEKLTRDLEDANVLFELGVSEGDEATLAEAAAQVPLLEQRVRAAELARMLSGPVDHAGAIVSIHPGTGGTDAKD